MLKGKSWFPGEARSRIVVDRGSRKIEDRGSRIGDRGSGIQDRGSRIEDRGSRITGTNFLDVKFQIDKAIPFITVTDAFINKTRTIPDLENQ